MNQLEQIIKEEITKQGPITFERFMELVLYYPGLGYYTSDRPKIGCSGDFYTSSDVGQVFGRLLGRQFIEMWEVLGSPVPFYLVEFGAGKGFLARDILAEIVDRSPQLFQVLTYGIVEISPGLRRAQTETLTVDGLCNRVHWVDRIGDLSQEPVVGCVLSNELVDAFPVHLIRLTKDGLREGVVRLDAKGNLKQEFSASLPARIEEFLQVAAIDLSRGQVIEVNTRSVDWLAETVGVLQKGYLLTIDYGYITSELAAPHRFDGTLLCYEKHRIKENPLENIGRRDITAHVNFTALMNYGERFGLNTISYTTQGKFLLEAGILGWLEEQAPDRAGFDLERFKKNQQVKQLVMPGSMGDVFKVLLQGKGLHNCCSESDNRGK